MRNEVFKTFQEVKEMFEKDDLCKRYHRGFDYARMVALTRYIEELSKREDFKLCSASPVTMYRRGENDEVLDETKTFSIGSWCRFLLGKTCYYIQITDNPFFDSYFTIGYADGTRSYLQSVNHILYSGVDWGYSEEIISKVQENLSKCFEEVNKPNTQKFYKEEYQSYDNPFKVQTIYTN